MTAPARRSVPATRLSPVVVRTREELAAARAGLAGTVALVPTMGALHDGHRTLLEAAREIADHVVVSIFVNPLQFGPGEDLDRYPRTFDADLAMCAESGVRLVFAPAPQAVYPRQPVVRVSGGPMAEGYEGASRPGHFDGVLTVVLKLANLVAPDLAVFGEKDAQQLALVRRMVADLDVPVRVVSVPTVREPDGLAMSSRNAYLSVSERASALAFSAALRAGAAAADHGADAVKRAARAVLTAEPGIRLDYLDLVDPATFVAVADDHVGVALLIVAAHVGTTRLIDNAPIAVSAAPDVVATAVPATVRARTQRG